MRFRRLFFPLLLTLLALAIVYFTVDASNENKMITSSDNTGQILTHKHSDKKSFLRLPTNLSVFDDGMNLMEKQMLIDTLLAFTTFMNTENLLYFLYGGSLLGAYRHAGIIPWDDDVDVWINNSQSFMLKRKIGKLKEYKLHSPLKSQWKFYSIHGSPVENTPYKWPYVDIYRFKENETHVKDSLEQYQQLFAYQKSDIFPLIKCQFETLQLNVPRLIEKIVTTNYDPDVCVSGKFNHRTDKPIRKQRQVIPCNQLSKYYKFGSHCGSNKK